MCQRARRLLRNSGIKSPDRFFGLLNSGNITREYLFRLIDHLEPGITEIGLHPAVARPPELARWAPSYGYREEFELLMSYKVREKLRTKGIELVSYRVFENST